MIFWKSWNWPSCGWECLLYWSLWHLVVETRWLTVRKPKFALGYYWLSMWRHVGTQHWSCSTAHTDYGNSHMTGSDIQNTLITGHLSQLRMNGPLRRMWWKYWGHFVIGPCWCWHSIQSHCVTLSQCTMTCSIIWTAWYKLWLRRRLYWRKTCSSLWS